MPDMEIDSRLLLDTLPCLVWTALPDGQAEYIGKQWLDYTGLTLEQAQGVGWTGAVHPDDALRLISEWGGIVASGQLGELEARLRRHDGVYRWFLFRACPLPSPTGRLDRWCGMNVDIDDRIRAEEQLVEHQDQSRRVLEGLPVIAALFSSAGQVIFCNGRMLDYFNTSDQDVQAGLSAFDYHPDDRDEALDIWAASVRLGEPFDREVRLLRADGDYRWHRLLIFPLRDAAHEIDVWYGVALDVDDAKRADAALRANQAERLKAYAHLSEAQQLSRTGSFIWDVERDEHDWSPEERRMWEFDLDAKITMGMILSVVHPEDLSLAETVIGDALHKAGFEVVLRIITKSGVLKHVHVVGRRVTEVTDRPVFLGAIQDITERTAAEEALVRARGELAHVSRVMTLSALTASIAHEVNQPLAGIIINTDTGLRMLAAESPDLEGLRASMQRTLRDGRRASEVILRLRAMFSRKAPVLEVVDLNEAVREVLAMLAGELQQRRVVLVTDLCGDLPAICGDRVQLQQVILNLVLNAADAMSDIDDRPRTIRIVTTRDGTSGVRLEVQDSGVGIDPDVIEKLFQPFYTTKPDGMGIGLAVSRTIIENHEGRLWAVLNESRPGSTFSILIPNETARPTSP